MNKMKRSFLFIVFGISLIVSHYAITYIYMLCLIAAWLILVSMDHPAIQELRNKFYAKFYKNRIFTGNVIPSNVKGRAITSGFVLVFVVFTLTWYIYVTSSSAFNAIVHIGDHIASSIWTDFLNPESVDGLNKMLAQSKPGLLHEISRIIQYLNQIFIVIGGIVLLLKYRELKFEKGYAAFSEVNLVILFAAVSVPFFAWTFNIGRFYHVALVFLAPFCVIGGITVFRLLSRIVRVSWTDESMRSSLKVLSVYFVIFMLYTSGFVYLVAEGDSRSMSIGQEEMKYGNIEDKVWFYHLYMIDQDFFGIKWYSKNTLDNRKVYMDSTPTKFLLAYGGTGSKELCLLDNTTTSLRKGAYLFMGYTNVIYGKYTFRTHGKKVMHNVTEIDGVIKKTNKIYSNGGCNIYVNS